MNKFFWALIIFGIIGCTANQQSKPEDNCQDLNKNITLVFKKFGQKVKVNCGSTHTDLQIKLYFYSPYFIDPETQKLLLSISSYEMYSCYKSFENINYEYIAQGLENDPLVYSQNKADINYVYNKFSSNIIFYDQVNYALNNMSQQEILASNYIIEELNKLVPDIFDFNGSFWNLLYQYSLHSNNPESKELKNFMRFKKVASIEGSKVNPIHLNKLSELSDSVRLN